MKKATLIAIAAALFVLANFSTASAQFNININNFNNSTGQMWNQFEAEVGLYAFDDSVLMSASTRAEAMWTTFVVHDEPFREFVWVGGFFGWVPLDKYGSPDWNLGNLPADMDHDPVFSGNKYYWNGTLTGLKPNTTYYYAVIPRTQNSRPARGQFTTQK